MKTFTVECPECDCELDVDIEEADLADTETEHIVTCADCQTETAFIYDVGLDDLIPADEEDFEPDDEGALDGLGDEPDDEAEDELA